VNYTQRLANNFQKLKYNYSICRVKHSIVIVRVVFQIIVAHTCTRTRKYTYTHVLTHSHNTHTPFYTHTHTRAKIHTYTHTHTHTHTCMHMYDQGNTHARINFHVCVCLIVSVCLCLCLCPCMCALDIPELSIFPALPSSPCPASTSLFVFGGRWEATSLCTKRRLESSPVCGLSEFSRLM